MRHLTSEANPECSCKVLHSPVGNEQIPIPPHCVSTNHALQGPDSVETGVVENPGST